MDFEDIANALWVGMIIVVAVLSGRSKRISGSDRRSKPSDKPDVGRVRKQIKTIQRSCNTDAQRTPLRKSRSDVPLSSVKRNFSAYKHFPKQTTAEESVSGATVHLTEPKIPAVRKPVDPVQKDVGDKKTKLREWITGQVVLDTPAFRKNYGNFFNR